jgi:hypothetical protein
MSRQTRSSGLRPYLLVAFAIVLLGPGLARAQSIQFRNETTVPIVVQASCVVRGALVRDRPYLVNANDKSPAITLPGNKIITVYEAKVPNRALFQGVVAASADNQVFSIQSEGTRVKVQKYVPKHSDQP